MASRPILPPCWTGSLTRCPHGARGAAQATHRRSLSSHGRAILRSVQLRPPRRRPAATPWPRARPASNWPMSRSSGRRSRDNSATASMRPIPSSRSRSPPRSRIRRRSSSPRQWRRSRRRDHPIARISPQALLPTESSRTRSWNLSFTRARRMAAICRALGASTKPGTLSRRRRMRRRMRSGSAAVGFWATGPARGRGDKLPRSFSTIC